LFGIQYLSRMEKNAPAPVTIRDGHAGMTGEHG
jgi:hypothetical protein